MQTKYIIPATMIQDNGMNILKSTPTYSICQEGSRILSLNQTKLRTIKPAEKCVKGEDHNSLMASTSTRCSYQGAGHAEMLKRYRGTAPVDWYVYPMLKGTE